MKKSRLPDTDAARIAVLPVERQPTMLRKLRDRKGGGASTYKPTKDTSHDILNVQPPMFSAAHPTSWRTITQLITKVAHPAALSMNLGIAKPLYDYSVSNRIIGRGRDLGSISLVSGSSVSYWHNLYLISGNAIIVPFIEPRRTNGLTREARRLVFSLMQDHLETHHPDLDGAQLRIFQFTDGDDDQRSLIIRAPEGPLYSAAEAHHMMQTTARIWLDVLAEGEEEERRSAGGGKGSLL